MIRPVVLIVLDGFGLAPEGPGNAVSQAKMPNFLHLWNTFPHTKFQASGEAVGLPKGESGNTETGHLNMGAGMIVYQDLPRINMAIADGEFYKSDAFIKAINHAKKNKSKLHLMGLVGGAGVHANNEHLFALLYLCKEQKFENVFIHVFTDGRDSSPTASLHYIQKLNDHLKLLGLGKIASVSGRYYAMDRDLRWDRTARAYNMMTAGNCTKDSSSIENVVKNSYERGMTDEFIEPTSICENGKPVATIEKNDAVIFFNFRIDRPRELTKAFVSDDFGKEEKSGFLDFLGREKKTNSNFQRGPKLENLFFVTMTEYEKNLPVHIAFPPQIIKYPMGRTLSERGLRQLRLTESEKERFVTFYFNGQRENPYIGEDRIIVPSPKIPTYDQKPEMSSYQITENLLKKLNENVYDFVLVNFPNPDMVGHTGNVKATVTGLEAVDENLGKIYPKILSMNGALLITADHGNCEEMIDPKTGGVNTEHSSNLVPFIIAADQFEGKPRELRTGILGDIAPTALYLMGIEKPIEMTGQNLLQ